VASALVYCLQLQARGDRAISVCPEASKELKALGIRIEEGIDITSDDSVANLHKKLGDTEIDVLINNAAMFALRTAEGIAKSITLELLDFDSIREQFEVNALGSLRVTQVLLPRLKSGGKVVWDDELHGVNWR
jgi:NAD(P)-dependent dehydrogenase (short-subunit alcohol dehydrogenase family)